MCKRFSIVVSILLVGVVLVTTGVAESSFEKATIRYAQGFTIDYHENYKLVTVLKPWNNADVTYQYLLVQRGTPRPEGYEHIPVIDIPVRSVVTMSTTHLANLAQLDLLDTLVGYSSFAHINTPEVLERIETGEILEVGADPNVNIELVMDLAPELILSYSLGGQNDAHFKLMEANLNVVIDGEYMEPTPLGRAEWVKFLAAFFNKERQAEELFQAAVSSYEEMAARVKQIPDKPTVFLNAPFDGTWWVPGGESYLAAFLRDAGARYLWSDIPSQGSQTLDFEAVYELAADADFWLNPGQWNNLNDGLAVDERLSEFRAFQEGNVYNNNASVNKYGGNDYWESGLTRPDVVLADLIKIFHPDLLPEHEFVYYQQLK